MTTIHRVQPSPMRLLGMVGLILLTSFGAASCGGGGGAGGNGNTSATTFSKSFGGPGSDEARAATPTADGGYVFVGGYGGDGNGLEQDVWISKLDANGDVQWQRTLTVRQAGALSGVVTSTPSGITCGTAGGGVCSAAFARNTLATLRADIGSVQDFSAWGPGCESISGNFSEICAVRVDADKTIDVFFDAAPPPRPTGQFTLTVTIDRLGGFIGTTDGMIGCQVSGGQPRTCTARYAAGTVVGLYAAALPGGNVRLESWQGDCASFGAQNEISLTMNRDYNCCASFVSAS